ncbi:response regulator transcription factor [Pseudomonas syringae]|uniref:response regulator transcription factor n=1 Tax=Pseudomonas syringae TaxID=317 RepID=UPI00068F23BF|nr:helix-turn-helix transcriptional regulator [Pseudomonas syringae]
MNLSTTITAHGITGFLGRGAAPRELECLLEIAAGHSTKSAAKQLGCTPSTVEKAIERAFFKLKVSSRAALVAEAFKRGLISFACTANPNPEGHENNDLNQGVFVA